MRRYVVVLAVLAGLALPANASAALWLLFDRTSATPNDVATVRILGTPPSFAARSPLQRPVRIYLVRTEAAAAVTQRTDRRANYVGSITPDRNGRGTASFTVPPLDAGTYTLATWCPSCAPFSRGRTFVVQRPQDAAPRYRAASALRISWPTSCPVTRPNGNRPPRQPANNGWYGNGRLWAGVAPDGIFSYSRDRVAADGSLGDKLLWVTTPAWARPTISGERLDAAGRLKVLGVNQGSFQNGDWNPSFMTPVTFPSTGCWRLRARVGDVSLTYVVRVAVG